jgi:hypothetical protein
MEARHTALVTVDSGRPKQGCSLALVELLDRPEQLEHRHTGRGGCRSNEPIIDGIGRALERGLTALCCAQRVGDALRVGDDPGATVTAAARAGAPAPSR